MLARARLSKPVMKAASIAVIPPSWNLPRPEDAFLDRGIANSDEPRLLFDGHMFFPSLEQPPVAFIELGDPFVHDLSRLTTTCAPSGCSRIPSIRARFDPQVGQGGAAANDPSEGRRQEHQVDIRSLSCRELVQQGKSNS
jgi:hypothetical protein